jgi:hypothetical protein
MLPFDQRFPEPLQGVINHAERCAVALTLAETDQSRDVATGPGELTLAETWVVGRAGEVEAVVDDIVVDWQRGKLTMRSASAAIECYLIELHRGMTAATSLGEPTCCSIAQESVTMDFFSSLEQRVVSYPRMSRAVAPPPVATT